MELFIDLNEKRLVQSASNTRTVSAPSFMQGDSEPLILHLIKDGADKIFTPAEGLKVALGRFGNLPNVLSIADGFTPLEGGGARVVLPLNTVELETAIGTAEGVDVFFEVEYTNADGEITTALQVKCRVKNDLIANAPAVELRAQYYEREESDATFAKRAENLSDVASIPAARANLSVYSKAESDTKYPAKTENLGDLPDIETARKNLDVLSRIESTAFYKAGIYSSGGLSPFSYGSSIGTDNTAKFTILTTFLPAFGGSSIQLYSCVYSMFAEGYIANKKLSYGGVENYDDEGNYTSETFEIALSRDLKYGERIALVKDENTLKFYADGELLGSGTIDSRATFSAPQSVLIYGGLKKDFVYSDNFALPSTREEGVSSGLKYSVEQWANGEPIPPQLINALHSFQLVNLPQGTSFYSLYGCVAECGISYGGKTNTALLYATATTASKYVTLAGYDTDACIPSGTGLFRLTITVFIPSDNTNLKKLQLRIGSYALSNFAIEESQNIENGYITTLGKWVTATAKFRKTEARRYMSGSPSIYFYNAAGKPNWAGANVNTDDRFYIANFKLESLEGITAFYEGGTSGGIWVDRTGHGNDLCAEEGGYLTSYPQDTARTFEREYTLTNLSWGVSEYEFYVSERYRISQILLTPFGDIPDTSAEESEYNQNRIKLSSDYGASYAINELVPAMSAYQTIRFTPAIIAKREYMNYFEVSGLSQLGFGGKIRIVFERI